MVSLESKKSKVSPAFTRSWLSRASASARSDTRFPSTQPAFQALTTVLLEAAKFNAGDEELTSVAQHLPTGIRRVLSESHVQRVR